MAWREGGGLGYSQLLPSSVWAGGFHCETLLGPEPRRMCLESCGILLRDLSKAVPRF